MRTLFRLTVLALAVYGAKTLYDQYGASLSGQAHGYDPADDGNVEQVMGEPAHEETHWSAGDTANVR